MNTTNANALAAMADALCATAEEAGRIILDIYEEGFEVELKPDDSPITRADRASHVFVSKRLGELYPDIPLLSEEGIHLPIAERSRWQRFFLLDPLDGTKEFVKRNGEFTVNIALVEGRSPVLGIVRIPVRGVTYWGGPHLGAFRRHDGGEAQPIATAAPGPGGPVLLASRSHPAPETEAFAARNGVTRRIDAGGAVKFCLLAEGTAHLYPRFNVTWEWDTAAGHALILGAGGSFTAPDGGDFPYNKEDLANGGFFAAWK
ncbi:3'(2'), 5'-bisphosphate nucleotidase [Desulfobaculum xiamenense]|uniref:3'(2'),5'-bisphosphate nucleotidase CysQ n=1 Tax=Desulfobaculum xiamenense TaxID=995050 RepID=A0A846QHI2_9BACT|nr:3'(2'),5'-bisphosphate nucleotidase CysQ [Desulfobaculum xiamenense]NJB67728.1 3'(2'), 5'-bisphosphate nucleotidase [Desulfobaculum xiamenense]